MDFIFDLQGKSEFGPPHPFFGNWIVGKPASSYKGEDDQRFSFLIKTCQHLLSTKSTMLLKMFNKLPSLLINRQP